MFFNYATPALWLIFPRCFTRRCPQATTLQRPYLHSQARSQHRMISRLCTEPLMDLMLLTHNSSASFFNRNHFISTPVKKIWVPFNASATLFILIRTVWKSLPRSMYKSPGFWGYFLGVWLTQPSFLFRFCSSCHSEGDNEFDHTRRGCISIFFFCFISLSPLHAHFCVCYDAGAGRYRIFHLAHIHPPHMMPAVTELVL